MNRLPLRAAALLLSGSLLLPHAGPSLLLYLQKLVPVLPLVVRQGETRRYTLYPVSLTYARQYVPLVWGSASAENEAVSVQLDLYKEFQKAYGSDVYEPKAGAVFGIFAYEDITAKATPTNIASIDCSSIGAGDMLLTVTTDEGGKAVESVKLPFGRNYCQEISTLDGYALNDHKFLFVVDEDTNSDTLRFDYELSGISGKVSLTGLGTAEIEVVTLYQVPALPLVVNGQSIDTSKEKESAEGGNDINIRNEVYPDRSITTITVSSGKPAVVEFANGAILTLEVGENTYTAYFTGDQSPLKLDTGTNTNLTVTENGSARKVEYTPTIAFTGYTVELESPYVEPETYLELPNGVTARFVFDKASGIRYVVILFPKDVPMPEYYDLDAEGAIPEGTPLEAVLRPEYLEVDEGSRTITLNAGALVDEQIFIDGYIISVVTTSPGKVSIQADGPQASTAKNGKGVTREGYQPDGALVEMNESAITLSHSNRTLSLHSANGRSAVHAALLHDYSQAALTVDGTILNAYLGNEPLADTEHIILNPGENCTIVTDDGAAYLVSLSVDRTLTMTLEGFSKGEFSPGANATHAALNGSSETLIDAHTLEPVVQEFPSATTTVDHVSLWLAKSVTYARDNTFVRQIQVKLNAGAANLAEAIRNERVPEQPKIPETPDEPNEPYIPYVPQPEYIRISKYDMTIGAALASAVIEVRDSAGNLVYRGITDKYGFITFEKPKPGVYFYHELFAPEGFELNTEVYRFVVNPDGTVSGDLRLPNKPVVTETVVVITKVDVTDGKKLPGAEIAIFDESGVEMFRGISNENGKICFTPPQSGRYTFVETVAPVGYELCMTVFEFTVEPDGAITGTLEIPNEPNRPVWPVIPKTGRNQTSWLFILSALLAAAALLLSVISGRAGSRDVAKRKDR